MQQAPPPPPTHHGSCCSSVPSNSRLAQVMRARSGVSWARKEEMSSGSYAWPRGGGGSVGGVCCAGGGGGTGQAGENAGRASGQAEGKRVCGPWGRGRGARGGGGRAGGGRGQGAAAHQGHVVQPQHQVTRREKLHAARQAGGQAVGGQLVAELKAQALQGRHLIPGLQEARAGRGGGGGGRGCALRFRVHEGPLTSPLPRLPLPAPPAAARAPPPASRTPFIAFF